jgi:D-alanyl-D-alanine carboxypeptidase
MLLDHTSGIFDFGNEGDPVADIHWLGDEALRTEAAALTDRYLAGERVIAPDRLLVALAETHDRYFQPGQGYHYSNINYQLAAMVLEKATGATIAELLATRIFEPLELRHTTIAPPDTASPELRGYGTGTSDGQLVDITDDLVAFGNGGNGGIISTADELLTMLTAITAGDLLPHELGAEMKSPTAQSDRTYGLGLATYHLTCGTFHGHEGGVNGTASIAIVQADGTAGTVVALNLRNGSDPRLTELADRLVCGAPG